MADMDPEEGLNKNFLEAPASQRPPKDEDIDADDFNAKKRSKTVGFRRKYNTSDPNQNEKRGNSVEIEDLDSGSTNSFDDAQNNSNDNKLSINF